MDTFFNTFSPRPSDDTSMAPFAAMEPGATPFSPGASSWKPSSTVLESPEAMPNHEDTTVQPANLFDPAMQPTWSPGAYLTPPVDYQGLVPTFHIFSKANQSLVRFSSVESTDWSLYCSSYNRRWPAC